MSVDTIITPVILSGGSGTRLWPMSRPESPKQLLALTAEETMLQLTARRTAGLPSFAAPIIVANAQHADDVEAQLAAIDVSVQALILEPMARNTAPAIALAALAAAGDTVILVMPSDHVITDLAAFHAAIDLALPEVRRGWLVTFGIAPDSPDTGYGWIKQAGEIAPGLHRVDRFVEKPPLAEAQAMLAAGGYYWNGGIFLFRADMFLAALAVHEPAMLAAAQQAMQHARRDGNHIHPDAQAFAASPANSVDYAVMEKADRVAVVPVAMGWSDVGSWDALHAISHRDVAGNAATGNVVLVEAQDCLVRSDGPRIAMVGVSDLIVVASGNDILIVPRGRSQDVKKLIEAMKR